MNACILIVDDNPVNLKLAAATLESDGHAVERAVDADSARQILERIIPDLILMDIALPGIDGLELTRQLKSDGRTARIPIVALTAFAMTNDKARALGAGCDGYITKPIDTRRFPAEIRKYLGKEAR